MLVLLEFLSLHRTLLTALGEDADKAGFPLEYCMDFLGGDFCIAPKWLPFLGLYGHAHDIFECMPNSFVQSNDSSYDSTRYVPQSATANMG